MSKDRSEREGSWLGIDGKVDVETHGGGATELKWGREGGWEWVLEGGGGYDCEDAWEWEWKLQGEKGGKLSLREIESEIRLGFGVKQKNYGIYILRVF